MKKLFGAAALILCLAACGKKIVERHNVTLLPENVKAYGLMLPDERRFVDEVLGKVTAETSLESIFQMLRSPKTIVSEADGQKQSWTLTIGRYSDPVAIYLDRNGRVMALLFSGGERFRYFQPLRELSEAEESVIGVLDAKTGG